MSKWKTKTQASKEIGVFIQKFIQTVCYNSKEEDSLTETRIQMCKQQNIKNS